MGRVKRNKNIQETTNNKSTHPLLTMDEHLRNLAEVLVERIIEEQHEKEGLINV